VRRTARKHGPRASWCAGWFALLVRAVLAALLFILNAEAP